jgi:hypothetical protein
LKRPATVNRRSATAKDRDDHVVGVETTGYGRSLLRDGQGGNDRILIMSG